MILLLWLLALSGFFVQAQSTARPAHIWRDGGAYTRMALSPSGQTVALGMREGRIRLIDADTGATLRTLFAHQDWITGLAFADEETLLAGDRTGALRRVDWGTGVVVQEYAPFSGGIAQMVISPMSDSVLVASPRGALNYVNLQDGTSTSLDTASEVFHAIAFGPEGWVAWGRPDGQLHLWRPGLAQPLANPAHEHPITALAFAPDGTSLLISDASGAISLWAFSASAPVPIAFASWRADHTIPPVTAFAFTVQGFASAGIDGRVRIWDAATGRQRLHLATTGGAYTSLLYQDGQLLALSQDGGYDQWDMMSSIQTGSAQASEDDFIVVQSTLPGWSPPSPDIPEPIGISLPSASIASPVTTFPLDGISWAIHPWEPLVGHLEGTGWLGVGNIALGGHAEFPDGSPGPFYELTDVAIGDEIFLSENGLLQRYVVVRIREVNFDDLSVVYPTLNQQITLITCDIPSYERASRTYSQRLVITAIHMERTIP